MPERFVERPARGNRSKYPIDALIETATNGQAVSVPLNGTKYTTVQPRLYRMMRDRGYKLHVRLDRDNDAVIAWAEKRPS